MKPRSNHTTARLVSMLGLMAAALVSDAFTASASAEPLLRNPEFRLGELTPVQWFLHGKRGQWIDRDHLQVTGDPEGSDYWYYRAFVFEPGRLYRFAFRARRLEGSGLVISGPDFANRDYRDLGSDWKWFGHVFRAPDCTGPHQIRLGLWHATGKVQFDAVRLLPAVATHRRIGDLTLGQGEYIDNGRYTFAGRFNGPASNYHRTLHESTAGFNSDRWCLGGGDRVVYRFALPKRKLGSGRIRFNVNYHSRGNCRASLSTDTEHWRPLVTQDAVGTAEASLPESLLPADQLFLRLEAAPGSSLQVNHVEFEAAVEGEVPDTQGETLLFDVASTSPRLELDSLRLTSTIASGALGLEVSARNTSRKPLPTTASAKWSKTRQATSNTKQLTIPPGQTATVPLELPLTTPGDNQLTLQLQPAESSPVRLDAEVYLPDYYRANYGHRVPGIEGSTAVWWCSATQKVAPRRPIPTAAAAEEPGRSGPRLEAARNDREAVQVVLRPQHRLKGLTAEMTPLRGPDGATIPPEQIDVLRVYYHFVHHPTDRTGVRDFWPDALPPLDGAIDLPADRNQPLWIRVHVPADAAPGEYSGSLRLKAEGFEAEVPLSLHVWDFALPKRNHLATAFGFAPHNVFRYHQLKSDEDKRRMVDKYLKCFADHRISPYDPTPMDGIRVDFKPEADPPRAELDFSAFDAAMQRAVDRYGFTHFRLPIRGMGGGTFHARHEPNIGRYGIETPQYHAMLADYLKQLESHLREKGWLDMAYVYWFDEPAPRDYDFVAHGMQRLRRYAPGLARMLTEEPVQPLFGQVDIWCPVSFNYDHEAAEKRRAEGERFWWYVCCGPKAPYCTLFIDHPATELRVWLWQTWQRKITGILVWQATYWTSNAAYPDKAQNPYEDPMGYVSGYSTEPGTKRFWGNGDGRFIYPPLAAATPETATPGPVLDDPVSSIRWEMLREGIEDYEMLYKLRELLDARGEKLDTQQRRRFEALLEVPPEITSDMTTFTTNPAPIYQRRRAVAEAIEMLSQ